LLAAAVWLRHRTTLRPVDVALLVHAALVWAFVNSAGPNVSIYRQACAVVGVARVDFVPCCVLNETGRGQPGRGAASDLRVEVPPR